MTVLLDYNIGCGLGWSVVEAEIDLSHQGVESLFVDRFYQNIDPFQTEEAAKSAFDSMVDNKPHNVLHQDEYMQLVATESDMFLFIKQPTYGILELDFQSIQEQYAKKFHLPLHIYCEKSFMPSIDYLVLDNDSFFKNLFSTKLKTISYPFYSMPTGLLVQIFSGVRANFACFSLGANFYGGLDYGRGSQTPSDMYKHSLVSNGAVCPKSHVGLETYLGIRPHEKLFVYWKLAAEYAQFTLAEQRSYKGTNFRTGTGVGFEYFLSNNLKLGVDYTFMSGHKQAYGPQLRTPVHHRVDTIGNISVNTHRISLRFSKSFQW